MNRSCFVCFAASALVAGQAFGLTMTPTADNRSTDANAFAGFDSDSSSDAPAVAFDSFVSEVSASANDFGGIPLTIGGGTGGFGSFADSNARQSSSLGALSITGSGSANASGSGNDIVFATSEPADGLFPSGNGIYDFHADATSTLEILFSIDESAVYDVSGFLTSNDFTNVDESGVIGPGNYRFTAEAYAEAFGNNFDDLTASGTDFPDGIPIFGPSTAAGFEQVSLNLRAFHCAQLCHGLSGVAHHPCVAGPRVGVQAGLDLELGQELAGLRQGLPDRRQERAPAPARLQHQPVHTGAQLAQQVGLVVEPHGFGPREHRDVYPKLPALQGGDRGSKRGSWNAAA
jgi:hypothetical protein